MANTRVPYSLINRAVLFTDVSLFTRTDGTGEPAYAVVVGGPASVRHAAGLARASGQSTALELLTGTQLKANQRDVLGGQRWTAPTQNR